VAIPALNRTTNPNPNHNTNPTYRNYPIVTLTKPYSPYLNPN